MTNSKLRERIYDWCQEHEVPILDTEALINKEIVKALEEVRGAVSKEIIDIDAYIWELVDKVIDDAISARKEEE